MTPTQIATKLFTDLEQYLIKKNENRYEALKAYEQKLINDDLEEIKKKRQEAYEQGKQGFKTELSFDIGQYLGTNDMTKLVVAMEEYTSMTKVMNSLQIEIERLASLPLVSHVQQTLPLYIKSSVTTSEVKQEVVVVVEDKQEIVAVQQDEVKQEVVTVQQDEVKSASVEYPDLDSIPFKPISNMNSPTAETVAKVGGLKKTTSLFNQNRDAISLILIEGGILTGKGLSNELVDKIKRSINVTSADGTVRNHVARLYTGKAAYNPSLLNEIREAISNNTFAPQDDHKASAQAIVSRRVKTSMVPITFNQHQANIDSEWLKDELNNVSDTNEDSENPPPPPPPPPCLVSFYLTILFRSY